MLVVSDKDMLAASYPIAFVWRTLLLGGFWWALTDGSTYAWWLGVVAVVTVAGLSLLTLAPGDLWWRPINLGRFVVYFAGQSLIGAVDVARRALQPRMPLDPAFVDYELRLRAALPRALFLNTLSLTPGTLSAEIEDDRLRLHVLVAGPHYPDYLAALERRVGAVFGESFPAASGNAGASR
ncbi:Na+/H+ antiporter subunit E [Ectothiorhodospiraceae bacterium 2226]|nr:Na+/H+ antiporter subunit E [Ectothiorhodospiraceae bacterium 2226]